MNVLMKSANIGEKIRGRLMECYCSGIGIALDNAIGFAEYEKILSKYKPDNGSYPLNIHSIKESFKYYIEYTFLEAISDAGIKLSELKENERIGIIVGSSLGFIDNLQEDSDLESSMDFSWIIQKYHFKGPLYVVSNTCTSSLSAITVAMNMLDADRVDICVVGGVDLAGEFITNGFQSLNLLNSEKKIDIFANAHTGTILSNASGFLVITRQRPQTKAYIKIISSVIFNEAFDITRLDKDGHILGEAIKECIEKANISIEEIGVLMTCANGTKALDEQQDRLVRKWLQDYPHTILSTIKPLVGHTLGSSTIIDIVSAIIFTRKGKTLSQNGKWLVKHSEYVLILSVGFAGVNGAVLLKPVGRYL